MASVAATSPRWGASKARSPPYPDLPGQQQSASAKRRRPEPQQISSAQQAWRRTSAELHTRVLADAEKQEKMSNQRWSERARGAAARGFMTGAFSAEEAGLVFAARSLTAVLARTKPQLKKGYNAAFANIQALHAQEPIAQLATLTAKQARKAVTRLARIYGTRLLVGKDVSDEPHPSGKSYEERKPLLAEMATLLIGGAFAGDDGFAPAIGEDGAVLPLQPRTCSPAAAKLGTGGKFRSIADARRKSVKFAQLAQRLQLRTDRSIWLNLRKFAPRLVTRKWAVKKRRNKQLSRDCALEGQGLKPVTFPVSYAAGDCPVKPERFVPINDEHAQLLQQGLASLCPTLRPNVAPADTASERVRAAPSRAALDADAYLLSLHDTLSDWQPSASDDQELRGAAQQKLDDNRERVAQLLQQRQQVPGADKLSAKEVAAAIARQRASASSEGGGGGGGGTAAGVAEACAFFTRQHMALLPAPRQQPNGLETYSFSVAGRNVIARGRWVDVTSKEYQYYWDPLHNLEQWHIDAFTIDPVEFLANQKTIGQRGVAVSIVEDELLNKPVGALPRMMVYIAVHCVHGTKAFFPGTGARGGQKTRDTYDGYQHFVCDLSETEAQHLRSFKYYNQPPALNSPTRIHSMLSEPVDSKFFLVRCYTCLPAIQSTSFCKLSSQSSSLRNSHAMRNPACAAYVSFFASRSFDFLHFSCSVAQTSIATHSNDTLCLTTKSNHRSG